MECLWISNPDGLCVICETFLMVVGADTARPYQRGILGRGGLGEMGNQLAVTARRRLAVAVFSPE